ncbi:hypothetical protein DL771_006825 [Monosporascus sp. 5C6A]|nr:hypothetical protein DL771_006825 [Monosporascus sp. 5C6A]
MAPEGKTKSRYQNQAEARAKVTREVSRSPSIPDYFGFNTYNPREQALANTLIKNFDKKQFRRLLIDWIVERNHPFTIVEEEKLRVIFEYLNPCVTNQDAHISCTTVKTLIINAFHEHKQQIVEVLSRSPGLIHIAFNGWRSGASIAAEILDVLDTYGIKEKIGYFTLDNAKNNDTAMEVIGGELGFNGAYRRGRCVGHTLNLSAKALLFGHDIEAFEACIYGEEALTMAEHELWRKKGPVGKLHNLVVIVHRSDKLTNMLRAIQADQIAASDNPRIRTQKPLDLNEYYTKLEETPIYVTALALHPAYRWRWFERNWIDHPEWIQHARDQVEDVWLKGYAHMEVLPRAGYARPAKRAKRYHNELQQHLEQSRYGPNTMGSDDSADMEARDALGEYEAWCMDFEPGDREVQDPIAYWIRRSVKYPRLSNMALDFLTIQPMSAECERLFSAAGRMVNELRSRLDVMLIEMCQTLRSWHRAGVINTFDVLFTSPDEAREMAKLEAMTDEEIREWATNWINAVSEDEMLDDEEDSLFVAEEGDLP